ncbi:hypothetical protein [Micromonospora sp. NBS 11-29]|uniref:hypothetical protein n=1 Tax=Micromonospora sp. NBS 11-29 TaxID=1960879 RepID=UPI000B78324A|nr:hypothetical protein [Micromonospora sp. NBS 11-29]
MSRTGHGQSPAGSMAGDTLPGPTAADTGGFAPDRPVPVPALAFLREGEDVVVGRHGTGSYAVVPADAAEVVHRLIEGMTPEQAGQWYASRYDEEIDIIGMLDDLAAIGVLDPPGAGPTGDTVAGPGPGPERTGPGDAAAGGRVRWQRLGAVAFSPMALVAYALLVATGVVVAVAEPDLRPHYGQIFFTDYLTIVTIVLAVGQWPFVLLHEAAHALAGRRLGLNSTLSIGHRLHYLVFETSMDGLVMVPRRSRWIPMLAGMGADLVVMALLTLTAAALRADDGSLPLLARVCLAISFGTMLRILWQFFFYLRTDLYYLLSLVLGTVDLHSAATLLLRQRIRRLLHRPAPAGGDPDPHPTDRRAARWYVWFMVAGYAVTLATMVFAVVPLALTFITEAVAELDGRAGTANLIDSAMILALSAGQLGIVGYLAVRNRRRAARARDVSAAST